MHGIGLDQLTLPCLLNMSWSIVWDTPLARPLTCKLSPPLGCSGAGLIISVCGLLTALIQLTGLARGHHRLLLHRFVAGIATCFGAQGAVSAHALSRGHHDEESARGRSCCQKGRIAKLERASVDGFDSVIRARSHRQAFRRVAIWTSCIREKRNGV